MVRNHSLEGSNTKKNLKMKNNTDNDQSNTKLIHSIHNHATKNQFTNIATNPNISKNIKMYQNHNLAWFEMGNTKN